MSFLHISFINLTFGLIFCSVSCCNPPTPPPPPPPPPPPSCTTPASVVNPTSAEPSNVPLTDDDRAFINGLPIDFRYENETAPETDPNRRISSPGCPWSIDGILDDESAAPWVYYGGKCYVIGVQGPCPPRMKLSINRLSPKEGVCQCSCFLPTFNRNQVWKPLEVNKPFCLDQQSKQHYAYFPQRNQCYPLSTQGPCRKNEWLVLDSTTKKAKCESRRCPSGHFWDAGTNSCKTAGCKCTKSSVGNCAEMDCEYSADGSHWTPICKPLSTNSRDTSSGINSNECPAQRNYSKIVGKCLSRNSRRSRSFIG